MKLVMVLACLLLFAGFASGQSTSVSATIVDGASQSWNNGTYSFTFKVAANNPTAQYFWNGAPFSSAQTISGNLDGTGSLSAVSVPSNTAITPSGSTWTFQACPAATATNGCFAVALTITGPTQNISSAVIPPPIVVNLATPFAGASAYTDSEISGAKTGSQYFNLSDSTLHVCAGFPPCTWISIGSTGSILASNNTFTGINTFTQTIIGNISGNAATATNAINATNATNATNLVGPGTVTGNYTHSGTETFLGLIQCRNFESVRCVDSVNSAGWTGSDAGAWINAAYADLPSSGGFIHLAGAASCYSQATAIAFNTANKPATLVGDGSSASCLNYTPTTGTAVLLDWGTSERVAYGLRDVFLSGSGNTNTTTGVQLGSTNGSELALLDNMKIESFGTGVGDALNSSFLVTVRNSVVSGNKKNISITQALENFRIEHSTISNFSNANQAGCLTISNGDVNISDTSMDSCQLTVSGLAAVNVTGGHMENPNSDAYDFVSFTGTNSLRMTGVFMLQDLVSSPNAEQVSINGNGTFTWTNSHYFSGATQTNFIKIAGGNPSIFASGNDDSSSAYSGGWLGGSTTGRIDTVPDPSTGISKTGQLSVTGMLAPLRLNPTDKGVCTMSAGTCTAQALGSTYLGAPFCLLSWTGGGTLTGILKIASTTTTVTPSSSVGSDTAQVNWACYGN